MKGTEKGPDRDNGAQEKPDAEENHAKLEHESLKRFSPVFGIVNVKRRIPIAAVSLPHCSANIYSLKTICELPNMREYIDTSCRKYACEEK